VGGVCAARFIPYHPRPRHSLRYRLKLANPELQVVVYSGDGDLFAIGGNHFIHARAHMDIKVICVNNMTYAMTGGQTAPTTRPRLSPPRRRTGL